MCCANVAVGQLVAPFTRRPTGAGRSDCDVIAMTDIDDVTDRAAEEQSESDDRLRSIGGESVYAEDRGQGTDGPARTVETLRQVQRELCLIELCWPDVSAIAGDLPESYRRVAGKERLLLWHAENFRRQFHAKYANRRPLLLACENECHVQKFVSTNIKRSTLPYPELYTWRGCAKFISDHIEYQPLDEPFIMPEHLRSPTWVLDFQKGNSFECATLLASLLLGQSYNAFVVSGYASREQVLCDMTRRTCPYLPEMERALPPSVEKPKIDRYRLKAPPDFRSQFLLELEERERAKTEAELHRQEEERLRMIAEFERPRPDKYFGHRIHAWVVILPEDRGVRNREITEPIFVEPSSGTSYSPIDEETNLLYLGVESIWNDQNYWVNMQPRREKGCAEINWDLSKIELWEHLLPGEPRIPREDSTDEIEEEVRVKQDKHLDMPASYVNEIRIHRSDFERRYPRGGKTILYKKARVELYAPYVRADNLIQRVTVYEDYEYTSPVQSYEKYSNRGDYLAEARRDFVTNTVTDLFEKGRSDHCKAHRYLAVSDGDSTDGERTIDFYDSAQFDGLSRIETGPHYLTQHYVDREDLLYYRHTEFSIDRDNTAVDGAYSRRISKITEKFHRNKKIPACKDVAVREFAMIENEICIRFHYDRDRSTRATRTFVKPSMADRGDRLVFDPTMTDGYNPDPTAPPEKNLDLFYALDKHLKDEDHSILHVRDAEADIVAFLRRRADENLNPQFRISLFDRDRMAELDTRAMKQPSKVAQELDELGPYLARIGNPAYISKTEAYLLRDNCLTDFKQVSIDKANRILRMIEKQTAEIEKMQALLTQSVDLSKTEEEQILAKINEISLNVHVLETYLNRYRDVVPQRYRKLVDRLQQNPHLQVLQKY